MSTVKVLGYSERGIINSIVFFLREQPTRIQGFLEVLGVGVEKDFFNDDCKYTFLNEQSFSQFGSNDLTIIAQKGNVKRVIFIEGKVKTYHKNTFSLSSNFEKLKKGETFSGISSNIFVQLYYKYLLTQVINKEHKNTESLNLPNILKKNNRKGKKIARKIGDNGIVQKAIDEIKDAEYYYVAILPIPKSKELNTKIDELNDTLFNSQPMEIKNITQVFWGDIEEHFKDVEQIKENFNFNYDKEKKKSQIYTKSNNSA